ncbi:MAG: CHASE3 domain-containing protein [Bacteroidota bacterium]
MPATAGRSREAMNAIMIGEKTATRIAQVCGGVVAGAGTLALAGWLTGVRAIANWGEGYIPMAPNTALCFILLGAGLIAAGSHGVLAALGARGGAVVVVAIALFRLLEFLIAVDMGVDRWIFRPPEEFLREAPVGQMAFVTAVTFLFAGCSALFMTLPRKSGMTGDVSGMLAIVVAGLGLAFALGYAFGKPILYSGNVIPMALSTAVAFLVFGSGSLAALYPRGMREGEPHERSSTLSVGRKILGGFGVALAAVLFVSIIQYNNTLEFLDSSRRLTHTQEVLTELEATFSAVKDMESSSRGYIITGDARLLSLYHAATLGIDDHVARLAVLTAGNAGQQKRMGEIVPLIGEKVELNRKSIEAQQRGGAEAAAAVIRQGTGITTMKRIRDLIDSMEDEEQNLLISLTRTWEADLRNTLVTSSVLVILVIALLTGIYVVVHRDLLGRYHAETAMREAKNLLDSIIEHIPLMVFLKDAAELRFVRFNEAGEDMIGFSRSELIGKNDFDFFPREQADFFTAKDREVLRSDAVLDIPEEPIQTKSRGTRILHTRKIALRDEAGEPKYLLGISEDVTERKRLEEERARLNLNLEAANRELEAFTYSVSHDLRAPLRHVDGFADLLVRRSAGALDEQSRRYLQTITDAVKHMGVLIDELLVFSRMGRVEVRSSRVHMTELVQDVIRGLDQECAGRVVRWIVDPLPDVTADPSMIRLVLVNLLDNAVKYTRPRAEAQIEIRHIMHPGEAEFFVRDNGVGFDMQYEHKLFGVFQRLHSASEFEGTGIGLANVRCIIHRHGGRTWAVGDVDKGAAIHFTLPADKQG